MTNSSPKIYLAGPDVFFPEAQAAFDHLDALCAQRGLQGVRPADGGMSAGAGAHCTPHEMARRIYEGNVQRIAEADGVIANMVPFRGNLEPDSGTVFEVGMAVALRKPVALYLPQGLEETGERIRRLCGVDAQGRDAAFGALIEDFQLPLNLMLACSSSCFERPEDALDYLAKAVLQVRCAEAASQVAPVRINSAAKPL